METKWIEEYKNLSNTFKLEEAFLMRNFLNNNLHLVKQFNSNKDEEKIESKNIKDTVFYISNQINDIISLSNNKLSTNHYVSNPAIIKNKLIKLNDLLSKSKQEFKSLYDKLNQEEISLSLELNALEYKIENEYSQKQAYSNVKTEQKDEVIVDPQKSLHQIHKKESETIESVIENIMNNFIVGKSSFPEDLLYNYINSIQEAETIKEKIYKLEYLLIDKLKEPNLDWAPKDHNEFIRVVNMHNGNINSLEFYNNLEMAIPYLPTSELRNHIKQYSKANYLKIIKRMLLSRLKEIKEFKTNVKKENIIKENLDATSYFAKYQSELDLNIKDILSNMDKIKINYIKTLEEKELINALKKEEQLHKQRKKKKEEVENWRKMREQQQNEIEEQKKKEQQEKKSKEILNMIKNNQLKQQKVKEYKEIKEFTKEKEIDRAMKDIRIVNKNHISDIDLERIKEKNELLINKKLEAKRAKSNVGLKVETNFIQYKENKKVKIFANVKSKLNENTTIADLKKRNKFDPNKEKPKDACSYANNVLCKTALKVPEWRKGI